MKIKNIYCLNCEIKGKKKRSRGIIPVKDITTGETVYMCKKCYEEWKQLQQILDTYGDSNTED